jgi:hypothetical protein
MWRADALREPVPVYGNQGEQVIVVVCEGGELPSEDQGAADAANVSATNPSSPCGARTRGGDPCRLPP